MKVAFRRGYAKWTDEFGIKHKVPIAEYEKEYVKEVDTDDEELGDSDGQL